MLSIRDDRCSEQTPIHADKFSCLKFELFPSGSIPVRIAHFVAGVTYSADFVSYAVLIHLLWPSRSYVYFNLVASGAAGATPRPFSLDELEFPGLVVYDSSSASFASSSLSEINQ